MKKPNATFPQVLRDLAIEYKINPNDVPQESEEGAKQRKLREERYAIYERAQRVWISNIKSHDCEYLLNRGATAETITRFGIGYAGDSWTQVYDILEEDYTDAAILSSGICIKSSNGNICLLYTSPSPRD